MLELRLKNGRTKTLHLFAAFATITMLPLTAQAATVYTFNFETCTTGCNVSPFGTVTLEQTVTDIVHVAVQLAADYSFRKSNDANHHSFVFNLSTGTATFSNLVTSDTVSQTFTTAGPGSVNMAGLGTFAYVVECTTCTSGSPVNPTRKLEFDLTASGLTVNSFVPTGIYHFAADIVGMTAAAGVDLTGNVATTGGSLTTSTPEPTSLGLSLGGLSLLALARKGRRRRA